MSVKSVAAAAAERRKQREQEDQAQVEATIAEFGGDVVRMAEEILYWRGRIKRIAEVVAKAQAKEPCFVLPPGRYWQPGQRDRGRAVSYKSASPLPACPCSDPPVSEHRRERHHRARPRY
jgi:hypothetical protein